MIKLGQKLEVEGKMPKRQISASELFNQFLPKHRKVAWIPAGFRLGDKSGRFYFATENKKGYSYYDYSYIDITAAGLVFTMQYDPASKADPTSQMIYACWAAILANPLKGRTFYAEPEPGTIEKSFEGIVAKAFGGNIPIRFSHNGEKVPGLHLATNMTAHHWSYFIPADSVEGKVIAAALALEQAQTQQQHLKDASAALPIISDLQDSLAKQLAAIPA